MIELSYNLHPDDEGIFDGRELARAMISDAFQLLVPYAHHCPACANNLFTVIANEELDAVHALGKERGRLPAAVMGIDKQGVDKQEAMARHIKTTQALTRSLLEKAGAYHPHDHEETP